MTPVSVTDRTTSRPVIADGIFVKSDASPDVWWVHNGSSVRNFVTVCTPCDGVDACGALVTVSQAYIDSLTRGANFTCAMLPSVNTSVFLFDVARNMAGFCTLHLPSAPAGTVLTLAHGEILTSGGDLDNTFGASSPPRTCAVNVINCADQMDQYVYGSSKEASWTPTFTFHGFRHVGLYGWPSGSAPTVDTLTCHQAHSDMGLAGGLTFNNTALNQIQAAIVQTQRSNVFSIPSDCPTREKRGWMGDAAVSSSSATCVSRLQCHLTFCVPGLSHSMCSLSDIA